MTKKRVGVVLSGCGVQDGAEIHEATLTLYFLDRAGAQAVCMAPDMVQHHVINHLNGTVSDEVRNVLVESARIARGKIQDLATVQAEQLDALILPGGFGVAKNLSNLAFGDAAVQVHPALRHLLKEMHQAHKPIGAICISPALLSAALAGEGLLLTIGQDAETATGIEAAGNRHQESGAVDIVVDPHHKVVTTAAYMCASGIGEAGAGIEKLVQQILVWC
ncbi:MAG: isoprenoid biosynthesis glyoxalase ElbB [Magnetococcales bacterium]|nr:isoprenoid biosynthesis glyoxalase ElbB [Magnetococcales bacterium]